MKKIFMLLIVLGMVLGMMVLGMRDDVIAETIGTFSIDPLNPHFEAHDGFNYAHTYVGNPDIWNFDFSGFSSGMVSITLKVDDYYPPYPDDYNLYWDGVLLGNTISPYDGYVFNFDTTSFLHALTVEYANIQLISWTPSSGGSYYDLWLDAVSSTTPVPEPSTLLLVGSGLAGLVGLGRKRLFKKV